jgi:hypothetical protein
LLLFKTQSDYMPVAKVEGERQVFYAATDGRAAGLSLSNGLAAFRVKAQSIPGARGAFRLGLQPVFRRPVTSRIRQLAKGTGHEDIVFESTGLEMQMSPGHFVILGPGEQGGGQMSLSGLFFGHSGPRPVVRIYLVICRNISD